MSNDDDDDDDVFWLIAHIKQAFNDRGNLLVLVSSETEFLIMKPLPILCFAF